MRHRDFMSPAAINAASSLVEKEESGHPGDSFSSSKMPFSASLSTIFTVFSPASAVSASCS
jgi:hypothetical protein